MKSFVRVVGLLAVIVVGLALLPLGAAGPEESDPEEAPAERELLSRALALLRGEFEERTWQAFWHTVVEGRATGDVARTPDSAGHLAGLGPRQPPSGHRASERNMVALYRPSEQRPHPRVSRPLARFIAEGSWMH